MQTRNKGSGLPDIYWVNRPESTADIAEFKRLFNKMYYSNCISACDRYYKVNKNEYKHSQDAKPTDGLPIYSYTEWKALLTGEAEEFKTGDWVYVINGGCRIGPGMLGSKLEGNAYQISEVVANGKNWKYKLVGNPHGTTAIGSSEAGDMAQYIRAASSEEITKAGGIVDVWKVGDVLPIEWLTKTHTYTAKNGRKQSLQTYWSKSHKVSIADADGWAKIGDTDTWLPPKHLCTPLLEVKKEVTVASSNIGRKVRIKGYTSYSEYNGMVGTVINDYEGGGHKGAITVKMEDGKVLWPYRPEFSTPQCEWVDEPTDSQIPVTTENAYVGMRVVRGKDWIFGDQDGGTGKIGVIVADKGYYPEKQDYLWVKVRWECGSEPTYRVGQGGKYDLYIAPETTVNQTINNSQNKLKTNSYEQEHSSKQQQDSYTGTVIDLCTDPETIISGSRRAATTVRCSGQSQQSTSGYRPNGQVLILS